MQVRTEHEPHIQEMYGFTSARKMASVLVRRKCWGCAVILLRRRPHTLRKHWVPISRTTRAARTIAPRQVRQRDALKLYNKGAAEWVLKKCASVMDTEGTPRPLDDAGREALTQVRMLLCLNAH